MSGSGEERVRANVGGTVGVLKAPDHEEVPSREGEEPTAVVDRIRGIAENLDVDDLHEEELTALSVAALSLLDVAKAQLRDRDIASLEAQVEDWERQHAEEIAGAEQVTNALAALRVGVSEEGVRRDDVRATLGLLEGWLTVDTDFRETHEKLKRAADEADVESVGALNNALASLGADRSQASAAIDGALAKLGLGEPTPEEPAADPTKPSKPEATEPADSGEEAAQPADPSASSAVVPSEEPPESTAEEVPAARDEAEDDQPGPAPDSPTRPDDDKASEEAARDPEASDDYGIGSPEQIEDVIATLIEGDRLGLAYHLSLSAPGVFPSANAIKLAACNYVTAERAPVAAELSELAATLLREAKPVADDGPGWRSQALLTTCAALAPAMAAPGGPVAQLLTFLEPWLDDTPSLRALAKTAADVSMTGVHLPIALLRGEDSLERWQGRVLALRNETKSWIANERQSKIKFQAATRVWRRMLEDWERSNGQSSLGRVLSLVVDNPIEDVDTKRVAQISEYWRAHGDKEIDRIDRENRSWKHTNRIEGSPRVNLRNKVNHALALSDRWLRLIAERPDKRLPFHTQKAGILRTAVRKNVVLALEELNAVPLRKAEGAQRLLRRYAAMFNAANGEMDRQPVGLTDLLNGDLLAHPDIVFDDTGQPSDLPVSFHVLWDLAQQETPDFAQAAKERAKRGDFFGAEAAVDIAEQTGRLDQESADRSRAVIEGQREHIQSDLEGKIAETSNRLDAAYAAGTLTLKSYEQQHDRIPLGDFSETNSFGPLFATLEEIDNEIDDAQARLRGALRGSLNEVQGLSQDDRERIELAINTGRFQVAEDFVERIRHGKALPAPETTSDRPFDRFFPHFVERYAALDDKEGDGIGHARRVIVSRDSQEFIDASRLSEDAAQDGVDLLDAWAALRDGPTSTDGVRALMSALGFAHPRVHGTTDETLDGEGVFKLQTAPVADRSIAQLPDFGSRAGGRYRVFAVRRRTTGEAIIREVGKRNGAGSSPNVVLFLGILDVYSRRSLARDFQTNEYDPTIVLDESLVVFLAAWRRDRLSAFFDCVSAFAFSQPFEPDAAELPPEMFFGRSAERQKILAMSHDMAHFVYGGRRLGKTTLLADVAREYRTRAPEASKELVLLINLKGTGIGENLLTEDLWPLFAKKLAEHGVVGRGTHRYETIGKSVRQWLEEDQGRRVLLLVDEADAFLHAERDPEQNYRVLEQVKRLMEQTERRFKVVFAGLHNVQRAARDPNTPFAHMGEAVRIGPMLPRDDGDEMQNLIRGPLEALGYRFVSNDSVIRIAAETNYYPALAQQFCKELLKTLREESHALNEAGPPYPIYPDLVDRVFNARETRDRIRHLFDWTVHLDVRYEFLTYLIAKESFDNEDARPQALPITAIRGAALSEWPKGFASDSSFWTFEVLLEEMVGLGILRETADKEYAIRTRNLRMLLGNDEEIERRFTDAKGKRGPAIFDPAQFRSKLSDDTPSSLTTQQQDRLLSGDRYAVGLVFGTHLAGLDRVGESLERASARWGESLFVKEKLGPAGLRTAIRQAGRGKHGTHVVLVDMRGAWDSEVLGRALEHLRGQQQQTRIVRPVFLCGPEEAWKWLNEKGLGHERVGVRDVWLGRCALDFARTYLKDQDRESEAYADLEKLHQRGDLPWPLVVGTAARNKQLKSINEAIRVTLNDEHNRQVSDIIQISEKTDTALRLLSAFPDVPMTADVLSDLSEDPDLSGDESATMSLEEVIDFFRWASRLGVVCRDENGYRLDSTYAEGLRRVLGG